ncbi:MAG: MBL fold metallo-hydrolase [Candidatus Omnitrophica bacterium]|nr:MBL fold metallo-hydrolase [Candidatus Omnitrophota bacterium]
MVKRIKKEETDFIKFLGTAGARFVMIKQLRASGGIWVSCAGTNIIIDPGPGSIVRVANSRPRLDPAKLDGIILTHQHLDHSSDVNVMIEAMTEGGFKKKGTLFCPSEALDTHGVILGYAANFPEKIEILKAHTEYSVANFKFTTSMRHIHPAETYGIKFAIKNRSVSLLTDTRYFRELSDFYRADILIVCVVFLESRPEIDHLALVDAKRIIKETRPKQAILTHFGMTMLKAKPSLLAEKLSQELGIEVIAAYDGMSLKFS